MQRRLALTLSGTAAVVVAAAGIAGAANLGLLASAPSSGDTVGVLDASNVSELVPTTSTTVPGEPVVVYVDEYVTLPGEAPPPAGPSSVAPGSAERTTEPVTGRDTPSTAPAQAPAVKSPPTTVRSGEVEDDHEDDHEDEHGVEVEHEDDDD